MNAALPAIVEQRRLASPAPEPQALGFAGPTLWVSSRVTSRLYAIDPSDWRACDAGAAPGKPYGLTALTDSLAVLCGEGPDDDRFIRRYTPRDGFAPERIACPDNTGSYLGFDGERLYVTQWYRKQIHALDRDGGVVRTIDVPHGICGCTIVEGRIYLLTTDDEETDEYFLTRVDARGAEPMIADLARVPFPGRSLAHDGEYFWTNHRVANEIVAFAVDGDD